jgi:hypothetical protein
MVQAVVFLGPMTGADDEDGDAGDAGAGGGDGGGDGVDGVDSSAVHDDESILRKISVREGAVRVLQEKLSGVRFDLEKWNRQHPPAEGGAGGEGGGEGEGGGASLPADMHDAFMDCVCVVGELLGADGGVGGSSSTVLGGDGGNGDGSGEGNSGSSGDLHAGSSVEDVAAELARVEKKREARFAHAMLMAPPPPTLGVVHAMEQLFNVNVGYNASQKELCAWLRRLLA